MHVLSIKVPIRKKSGNLFNDPHIYIYIYIYIYIFVLLQHISLYNISMDERLHSHLSPKKNDFRLTKNYQGITPTTIVNI